MLVLSWLSMSSLKSPNITVGMSVIEAYTNILDNMTINACNCVLGDL